MKVFVGMSGGVDSSVTAKLMVDVGHDVTGVYMKNWSQDLPGHHCPWLEDYQDAKRVAVQLGIKFEMYDFETQYREKVVDYMIEEFKAGRTPNPDITCNQEIKFKLFLETALANGADMIATGHYASTDQEHLLCAVDENKDQTYFLYRVTKEALAKTYFPLGKLTKPEVRLLAEKYGLATAKKKESMGICFVGKVGIKEFLSQYVETKAGEVKEQNGVTIGEHEGAIFYTIGQRHGLNIGGGLPYYVVGKDMDQNIVYVTSDINDNRLWRDSFNVTNVHWIGGQQPKLENIKVRTRHRANREDCELTFDGESLNVKPTNPMRAITPGQSAVFYQDDICLGGGIII